MIVNQLSAQKARTNGKDQDEVCVIHHLFINLVDY